MTNFFNISIDISQAENFLNAVSARIENLAPILGKSKSDLRSDLMDHIDKSQNPNGFIYPKLSQNYINSKSYKNRPRLSPKPLDTQSYRDSWSIGIDNNIINIQSNHIGVLDHEKGGIWSDGKHTGIIPIRSVGWLSDKAIERLSKSIIDGIINNSNA